VSAEPQSNTFLDIVKMLLSLAILVAGIAGFYYFEDQSAPLRALGVLVAVVVAVFVVVQSTPGRNVWAYVASSRTEVRKMVWPTRAETLQTTLIIFVVVLLLSIFLWLFDMLLVEAVQLLTGRGNT